MHLAYQITITPYHRYFPYNPKSIASHLHFLLAGLEKCIVTHTPITHINITYIIMTGLSKSLALSYTSGAAVVTMSISAIPNIAPMSDFIVLSSFLDYLMYLFHDMNHPWRKVCPGIQFGTKNLHCFFHVFACIKRAK